MIDITKPMWFVEIPNQSEHNSRIMNIVNIKQYLLRQHKILQRQDFTFKEQTYQTAKTVLNSIKSVVNFHIAYTIGTPLELQGNAGIVNAFNRIIKRGGYSKVDYEIVGDLVKYGNAYEYIYVTKDGKIKSKVICPEDAYPIYDDNYQYVSFLEFWEDRDSGTSNFIVYYPDRVETWQNNNLIDTAINLSGLPIHYASLDKSEYNHFGDAGLLDLIPIMDSIEKLCAKLDDAITTLSLNPIGVATGQSLADSSINRDIVGAVVSLEDGGDFRYANSIMDYQNIKLLLETYLEQFYATACIPASLIGSSSISNISEVSLKLMLIQTDNRAAQNIQVLTEGIYKRLEFFNKLMRYVGAAEFSDDDFDSVEIVFSKNRPTDSSTVMNQIKTQWDMGCISRETILDISPFIIDTQLELNRLKEEGIGVNTTINNVVNVGGGNASG
jgi:SPP1 family phage portal protein